MQATKKLKMMGTLLLSFAIILTGCSSENTQTGTVETDKKEKEYTLKVANFFPDEHPTNIALEEKFKKMVEADSKGTLKVEIFGNSELGADQELFDGVRAGTIEMGLPGMLVQSIAEKMATPEFPFLIKDFDHAKKVLDGPIGDEMVADLEAKAGVKALAWTANGFRMISSNKPIEKMEDFEGFRLRMPSLKSYVDLGQSLGANVTPMPIPEVFTALEQKVVDGQDNPVATFRSSGWYEVQTHVLESKHVFSPNIFIVNNKVWKELSPHQQKILEEAAQVTADYQWELLEQSYEADKKHLEEQGIVFTVPNDKFQGDMEKSVEPMYEEYYKKYPWAKDMVEKIRQEAQ